MDSEDQRMALPGWPSLVWPVDLWGFGCLAVRWLDLHWLAAHQLAVGQWGLHWSDPHHSPKMETESPPALPQAQKMMKSVSGLVEE